MSGLLGREGRENVCCVRKPKTPQPEKPRIIQERDNFSTPWYATDLLINASPWLKTTVGKIVWEPAAGEGYMVKRMEDLGHKVVATDLAMGPDFDFLTMTPPAPYDAIITNPPFSLKRKFYQRCRELDMPFALLIPGDWSAWLIEAVRTGCRVVLPNRRINYVTPNGLSGMKSQAQFHSIWLTRAMGLPEVINFATINRAEYDNIGYGFHRSTTPV